MQKLISTLLTIIFFQTQIFSFPAQPTSVLLPVNNSVINNPIFGYQNSQSSNFVSLSHCEPEVKQSSRCCYRFQSSAFVGAVDYEITERKHKKKGGLFDMIDISNMKLDISGGGISLSTSYKESKDKENITSQKAVSNVIQSGNNIILETSGDLISQASQIVADGNIDITTGNNLILTFAEDVVSRTKEHSETTVTVGVKIGNAYVDVGLAAKNLVDSTKSLNEAKDDYNEKQKKYDRGEISKTALEDAKINLEIATLNVSNATIALATSINGVATSASSSLGTGLYGSAFTNYETTTTENKEKTVIQNFGLISSNKDIRLRSGTNLVQEATDITAKETLSYDVGKELSILAGKTTGEQESKREHKTAGISYGNNAVQVSGSYGQDSSKAKTTSYTNSQSMAKDIIIKAEKANISGANIQATNKLEVDIRNNLLLESKQDNYYLKGNGYNVGGSIGIGVNENGSSTAGANYGNNKSDSDVNWVNQQTSLTGANSVNILVGNKTEVKGAVIANAETTYNEDGKIVFSNDKGNLNFITKELEYSDIKDKNVSESNGFNVGLTVGAGTDKQTATKYPKGSLNIGATASGQEKEQLTKATIGAGTIIVDGKDYSSVIPADSHSSVIPAKSLGGNLSEINTTQSLLGLNRDISTTQELTKSQTTRALNINTTIDLRLLTKEGRKDIWNDIKNAPKNINQIGKNITKNNIIVQSVKNAITDEDINIIEAIKDYIKTDKQIRKIQSDKETTETLNGATNYSVEEVKGALQEVANTSLDGSNAEVTVYNNESGIGSKGYSYIGKDGTTIIGLNTETTDITNSGDIINTMYHEATHINKGTSEKTATNYGDTAQSIWDMYNFGNENTNIITGEQWNEKNRTDIGFIEGNNIALANYTNSILGLGIFNERVTEYSRDLDGVPVGKHSFLLLEPDNMDDFTEEKMKQMGFDTNKFKFIDIGDDFGNSIKGIIVGGYNVNPKLWGLFGELKSEINQDTDVRTVQEYKNNGNKTYLNSETRVIKSQLNDTTFIYNILNNTSNYITNTEIKPVIYILPRTNCHTFTNKLLDLSGADLNRDRNMKGLDPGRHRGIFRDKVKDSVFLQIDK